MWLTAEEFEKKLQDTLKYNEVKNEEIINTLKRQVEWIKDKSASRILALEVFKINNEQLNPIEKRVRWGKHIYSFTEFFAFPAEGQFFLEVSAEDMEGNARSLRVPIMIGKLGGLQLKDRSEESRRRE